jgi:sugar O-acyltransferase (sialic acid O-acetyltransferase NeuD family)
MDSVAVFGASGHAGVVIDIIEKQGSYRIAGLIDSQIPAGAERFGYRVLGHERDLLTIMVEHNIEYGIVAIGSNFVRHGMARRILEVAQNLRFVSAIHPSAQIARGVSIGPGTVVMAGAVINTNSRVAEHCIVNTNASVDHDNVLERFSSLGPRAATGGNVRIGEFSVIGLGASVIHGRTIGMHTVVGAGATVIKDIPDLVVAYGTPAAIARTRQPHDQYL